MTQFEWNWKAVWITITAWLSVSASANEFTLTSGLDYSSGKYGGSERSEIWYVPVTGKFEIGAATFKLTLPYVRITAPSGGTLIDGRPVTAGSGAQTTESGQGDVVASYSYSYSLLEQPVHGFLLDLTAKVKLATADEAKGLGSGENDYSVLADLYYLAGAWTPFVTVSYRVTGDPAGSDLKNVWGGTLGLGYKQSPENNLGLMWDMRQASADNGVASNDITAYWVHKFSAGLKLQSYVVKGFSSASADWGMGLMLGKTFR